MEKARSGRMGHGSKDFRCVTPVQGQREKEKEKERERNRERERGGSGEEGGETGRLPREITILFRSRGVWKFSSPPGGTRRWLLAGGGLDPPS